jgi:class 3 adenylate cyclase
VVTCPSCGQENPEGFRFCGRCASPLESGPEAARVEERKVVSVLFCDLVGFTARSDRADPEDVRATLRPYHTRLRREIERFGGTVEKFIGDAVMAVFGAPVAHEDDAERAVRAGLRIVHAIEELNEEQPGLDLAVRIGVNTGEAVVVLGARPEHGEGIATGDVVNTASRLQGIAPVGGVAVGEPTYRATREVFEYEDLDPVTVKGKADPVPVWRAVAARSRFGVDVEQGGAALIGRDADLNLLKEAFARTVRDQSTQLVTVVGAPGVGKSRLIWEFQRHVDDRPELVYWRQGRCLPYGDGIAFWALGEMVKAQAGILESDDRRSATAKLEATIRTLAGEDPTEIEWLRGRLAPLVGLASEPADREEAVAAWRKFLSLIAASRPLVAVFEDLHWADPAMYGFLEELVEWETDLPLLVVCSARPELYERRPGWGGGLRNAMTIALEPLAAEDTARLISELLSQAVLPADTQAALIERSGGNPLYAEEFVKMLVDRGVLTRDGSGPWRVAGEAEIAIPDSVQALIAARLDTLPADRKALLQDGAVIGKVFWSGALASMSGTVEGEVRDVLHEVARAELLRRARSPSMEGQVEYVFRHALIRDVVYAQIPRAARARKHAAAAEWLEGVAGERVTDHADFLAHHYSEALTYAESAGDAQSARRLTEPARRFLVMAGDRSRPLDPNRSLALYRQALDLTPEDDPAHPAILLSVVGAGSDAIALDIGESIALADQAAAEYRALGDPRGEARALSELGSWWWVRGDTARTEQIRRDALALLEGLPPGPDLRHAYVEMAGRAMLAARLDDIRSWVDKAIPLIEAFPDDLDLCRILQYRGIVRCGQGDLGGLEDLREAVRLGVSLGFAAMAVTAYINLADFVTYTEGPRRGMEVYREGIAFGAARGQQFHPWAMAETTWNLYDLGEWDEVVRVCDVLIQGDLEQGGGTQVGTIARRSKAAVLLNRGDVAGATALRDEFLEPAREAKDPQQICLALATSALLDATRGDAAAVAAAVDEFDAEVGSQQWLRGAFCLDPIRALVVIGDLERGRSLLDRSTGVVRQWELMVDTARALVAEAEGELRGALRGFEAAAQGWRAIDCVVEDALASLGAGRCLIGLGRHEEGRARLRAAREAFVRLGATPWIEEADRWLQRATALTS